jgi:hypothetical protein
MVRDNHKEIDSNFVERKSPAYYPEYQGIQFRRRFQKKPGLQGPASDLEDGPW